jgi:hypothetical protein
MQWPIEKGQITIYKHTHRANDGVIRTPLKTGVNSGAPEVGICSSNHTLSH